MKRTAFGFFACLALAALALSACGNPATQASPTATIDIAAMSTSIAQTIVAQITESAPTITNTPENTNTPSLTPTSLFPQSTNTSTRPTPSGCSNMTFVSDVSIPDETQLSIGQSFSKTWRVKNSGTCAWTTGYKLAFSYGERMEGQSVSMPAVVEVGQTIDLSVNLKVPNKASKLTGVWTLLDDKGQPFGPLLTVVIIAGNATATPTKTLTPTLENTATETLTPTP